MKWTIINEFKKNHKTYCLCKCVCGIEKEVRKSSIGKDSFSCKKCSNKQRTHGLSTHPLYKRWVGMKQRCTNPNTIGTNIYQSRGIEVCKEWLNFKTFLNWALDSGYSENLTIDRINNEKGYSAENCRWITPHEQNRNQRTNVFIEHFGVRKILKDWCAHLGLNYGTVRSRVDAGQSYKLALGLEQQKGL